ncbi:putative lipase atg15 [Tulasnella sp. 419]|nr:putative lipase atg15 [Tulasnella sp. 419]
MHSPFTLSALLIASASAHQIPLTRDETRTQASLRQPSSLTFNLAIDHGTSYVSPHSPTTMVMSEDDHSVPLPVFRNRLGDVYSSSEGTSSTVQLKTRPMRIRRPKSQDAFHRARIRSLRHAESEMIEWEDDVVIGPDIEDRLTILELAKMTGNAYALSGEAGNWYPLDERWNTSTPFGWNETDDGFRGHVFSTADNSSVILSIKGTTLIGNGPTAKKDKLNDNRLFSCCCGRVNWAWRFNQVCDCYSGSFKCDSTCLSDALAEEGLFYGTGVNLYNNLTHLYPHANIWIVGHSLGGALASLLGITFGVPVVTFEAPGERLAATRLHLPMPAPGPVSESSDIELNTSTYHVYHTADPIPQGSCTGLYSVCQPAGYAMESRCHLGKTIVYDTVTRFGWRSGMQTHPIKVMITKVLNEDWNSDAEGPRRPVPRAKAEVDCVDCSGWKFGDFKDRTDENRLNPFS